MKDVRRGFHEEDDLLFGEKALPILKASEEDIVYLLNRGYPFRQAVTFAGNHYRLTARQRDALLRISASDQMLEERERRQLSELPAGCTVHIDAFNAVILMETVLSGSMILKGRDGCFRDLSGLAGTYSVITKTGPATEMIMRCLQRKNVKEAVFWVDMPVSNSGRLKTLLAETAEKLCFPIDIRMVHDADAELKKHENVISADSAVISECISWYNLYADLIENEKNVWITDLNTSDR